MPFRHDPILGNSAAIRRLRQDIDSAADCDSKVLITGESGAGKELVGRVIHARSARAAGPFQAINCAAMAESLLESELFGHVRGSFTDAYRDRGGVIDAAQRGSLLLDEVAEMSLRMQGLLLRFLETGEIQRVGEERPLYRTDVRVMAATNVDLQDAIDNGAFRHDLYYRLAVLHVHVPPLRERRDDIMLLFEAFMAAECRAAGDRPRLTNDAVERLTAYEWPGNVRELRNFVERLVVRHGGREVGPEDLPLDGARLSPALHVPPSAGGALADQVFDRLVNERESFWFAVYDRFMSHDLTRADVRRIISQGLERTRGSYPLMYQLFNLAPGDVRAFQNFLHKYQCDVVPRGRRATASNLRRVAG